MLWLFRPPLQPKVTTPFPVFVERLIKSENDDGLFHMETKSWINKASFSRHNMSSVL